jgi:hypothetical protein
VASAGTIELKSGIGTVKSEELAQPERSSALAIQIEQKELDFTRATMRKRPFTRQYTVSGVSG